MVESTDVDKDAEIGTSTRERENDRLAGQQGLTECESHQGDQTI